MQFNEETQFVTTDPGNGSTFDDILQSVQAGIDVWRRSGNNTGIVGPTTMSTTPPAVTTSSSNDSTLVLVLIALLLIFFMMKD